MLTVKEFEQVSCAVNKFSGSGAACYKSDVIDLLKKFTFQDDWGSGITMKIEEAPKTHFVYCKDTDIGGK